MHSSGNTAVAPSPIYFYHFVRYFEGRRPSLPLDLPDKHIFLPLLLTFHVFIYDLLARGWEGSSDHFQIGPMYILWGTQGIWIESAGAASVDS